jgi:peptide/nickel transport system substrate-binding protein
MDYSNPSDRDVDRLIYSGLVRFDDRGMPLGDLAESWGISQNGKIYNFTIRSDARWHDGEPVTSDDVLFTVDLMRDENSSIPPDVRDLWEEVEVERLDETTIQFRLPEAYAPFMDYLAFGVLPKHILDGMTFDEIMEAPFNLAPVGSGPYRFDRLITENGEIKGVVLKAFEDYYLQRPFIEEVVFRYFPDAASVLAAYKAAEVMGIGKVSTDILTTVLKEPNLRLYSGRLPEMTLLFLNLDHPKVPYFKEQVVRQALLLGLNRQGMVDQLLGGQAIVADGPIFPNTWAYYNGLERVNYDPERAIALLKEAGFTIPAEGGNIRTDEEGNRLEFDLVYPEDEKHAGLAEAIQKDWEQLGVQANLIPVPYDELVNDHLNTHLYQAALADINLTRTPDPDPYPFWHQAQITGGQNYSNWDDRQASEYLEEARVTSDLDERAKRYRNFQVRFSQELPALPLFFPIYNYAVSNDVQGVTMGPLFDISDRFSTILNWYLVESASVEGAEPQETGPSTPAP